MDLRGAALKKGVQRFYSEMRILSKLQFAGYLKHINQFDNYQLK